MILVDPGKGKEKFVPLRLIMEKSQQGVQKRLEAPGLSNREGAGGKVVRSCRQHVGSFFIEWERIGRLTPTVYELCVKTGRSRGGVIEVLAKLARGEIFLFLR
jgi:hypothetical protein